MSTEASEASIDTEFAGSLILAIDDNPTNLGVIVNLLEYHGVEVIIARNGADGIQRATAVHPDLILLDIMMGGGLDGYDTCQRLKAQKATHDIPVIFLTALTKIEEKVKGFEVGAVDYITKPLQEKELLARIQTHLKIRTLTKSLQQKNIDLNNTLSQLHEKHEQLKTAQMQLVHSEKMASLGTLTAGIAHEVNNPNNFISAGVQSVSQHLELLKEFIFNLAEDDADPHILQAFEDKFAPLFSNLDSIYNGSERIRSVVADLHSFSRLAEAQVKSINIIESFKATLRLVEANFHETVQFIYDFQATPELECQPAQLNQAFLNIMINGCQAIEAKQSVLSGELGQLTIRSFIEKEYFHIHIHDTGVGMSQEVQSKIFDPFFTTKDVGSGKGLGLSVAIGIIENHKGTIKIDSTEGEGSTFKLQLPLTKKR